MEEIFHNASEPAVVMGEKTYVWRPHVDTKTIIRTHAKQRAKKAVLWFFLFLVLFFLLLSAYGIWREGLPDRLISFSAWAQNSFVDTFFLLAFLCIQMSFYRSILLKKKGPVLPSFSEGEKTFHLFPTGSFGKAIEISPFFEEMSRQVMEEAYQLAKRFHHAAVLPIHLFLGCLSTKTASIIFYRLGISFEDIKEEIQHYLNRLPSGAEQTLFEKESKEVMLKSFLSTIEHRASAISVLAILENAYAADTFLQEVLYRHHVEKTPFFQVMAWVRIQDQLYERYVGFTKAAAHKPVGAMNRAMTSVITPILDQVSDDLTMQAVSGHLPMLMGREKELRELFRVIEGGGKSVLLVGSHGVGKEAVIHGIAQKMVEEEVPEILQDKRLIKISLPHLLAAGSPAQMQERFLHMLSEIGRSKNIVLAMTDIEQLADAAHAELASLLIDALARHLTFVIATTTPQAYASFIEHGMLGHAFSVIRLEEPSTDEAIAILESKIGMMEGEQQVSFSFAALSACVMLSHRYMHETFLPEKAIDIAKEVALSVKKIKGSGAMVSADDVAEIISEKSHVPVTQVGEGEKETLLHLEDRIHGRVIGQSHAVSAVANAMRRARVNLAASNRPLASFLFLGPTGVGKTELAKTLAEVYFGGEQNILRFDMSEYQNKNSLERLIGQPGDNKGGLLTEAVRKQPFSLLLFDELEKAHPDILNLFLQVMDDGRLTDSLGQTVDFTSTIVIATSNAGTSYIQEEVAKGTDIARIKTGLMEEKLQEYYRPEFLNRFDEVIVFEPLTLDAVTQIAYLLLEKVKDRLDVKGIHLEIEDAAVAELAQKGYDPQYGARPLRRVIQDQIDNQIATILLEQKADRGDTLWLRAGGMIEIKKREVL